MTLLERALEYAARGWRVHPLHDVHQGRCSCMGRTKGCKAGKHPRLAKWQDRATTDPATLKAWWTKWPMANVGIITGHTSGIVVLDIDDTDQVPALVRLLGLDECFFLDTMTVETGSGGYHLYFKSEMLLSKDNTGAVLPGVDFIGEGGYVVAPPSQTGKGKYTNLADADPAPLPAAILPSLRVKGPSTGTTPAPAERPRRNHPTGPHGHMPFPWGTVGHDRVPGLTGDMVRRFPIARTGEHSNRDDQTIRLVAYLLVVGHSPATAKEVGRHWLAAQRDQFKTSQNDAVILLEEKIRRTHRDIRLGKLARHTEEQWLDRIRNQGLSYRLAYLSTKKMQHPNTTGLGGQRKQLSPREAAYVLAVLRLVLFKLLETDESSILVTNRQLMDLAGLSDPKQARRMRDKFISEGKRLAGVMELLVLEKKGGKEKGKGFPSSYAISEDLGALLASEPEYEDRYDPATEASEGHETHGDADPAENPPWDQTPSREPEKALPRQAVRGRSIDVQDAANKRWGIPPRAVPPQKVDAQSRQAESGSPSRGTRAAPPKIYRRREIVAGLSSEEDGTLAQLKSILGGRPGRPGRPGDMLKGTPPRLPRPPKAPEPPKPPRPVGRRKSDSGRTDDDHDPDGDRPAGPDRG